MRSDPGTRPLCDITSDRSHAVGVRNFEKSSYEKDRANIKARLCHVESHLKLSLQKRGRNEDSDYSLLACRYARRREGT